MSKLKMKNRCDLGQIVILHYLLNDYATLLEYLIGTYPNIEHPIFTKSHYLLFQNRLELTNQVIDKLDKTV